MDNRVYLDNAATTAIDPLVAEVVYESMLQDYGNPSSIHTQGRKCKAKVEQCRKNIAKLFNASPSEIVFTSGGTESDNLAIRGIVSSLNIKHIISSKIEHSAVINTILDIVKNTDAQVHWVNHLPSGLVDLTNLQEILLSCDEVPALVSLMHVNNEVGNITDLEVVGDICKSFSNIYFHSDTVQSVGHFKFDLKKLNIDFITCSAHKIHGPKGVGFLYVKNNLPLNPMVTGGSQERNGRAGTENVAGIVGMEKALSIAYENLEKNENLISDLNKYAKNQLTEKCPSIEFNTNIDSSTNTILNLLLPSNKDASILLFNLDLSGISVSGGSACTSGSNKGSHVLTELGVSPDSPSIRISFSRFSSMSDIDKLIEALIKIL